MTPKALLPGETLYSFDDPLRHIYFVEGGLVSMVVVFENGTTTEVASVGREGLVGIGSILGRDRALGCYIVPIRAFALAITASQFKSALRECRALRTACEAYTQAFIHEALQTAACNSIHMVDEQFARRLLMSHDQSDDDTLALTQECLAKMLGVCRSTVTLGHLEEPGVRR